MNVLVLFEYSGIVRDEFIKKGHKATSLDLLPSESNLGDHIQVDINVIEIDYSLFDLIIMHPECTRLCVSGNATYAEGKEKYQERLNSIKWTEDLWFNIISKCNKVCMENPVGVLSRSKIGKPTQYIQPYMFGHTEKKKTGLWLYNLPKLIETNNVYNEMTNLPVKEQNKVWYSSPGENRWKLRSKTYSGIAKAMAEQWG